MNDNVLGIGFFQFDNLVKGRVGFLLVNLGVSLQKDFAQIYQPFEIKHVERYAMYLQQDGTDSVKSTVEKIKDMKLDLTHPIVILANDAKVTEVLAQEVASLGFINCYFVVGGFQELLSEVKN